MATATTDLSAELIRSALKSISIKNVQHWCANHLPRSLQSLRQEDLAPTAEETNLRKHTIRYIRFLTAQPNGEAAPIQEDERWFESTRDHFDETSRYASWSNS